MLSLLVVSIEESLRERIKGVLKRVRIAALVKSYGPVCIRAWRIGLVIFVVWLLGVGDVLGCFRCERVAEESGRA